MVLSAGAFDGIAHATQLMDRTQSTPLRHSILKLLHALLCPRDVGNSSSVSRVAVANASTFTEHGGVELLADLVCIAHEGRDRTPIGRHTTNLIAATSYSDCPKVGSSIQIIDCRFTRPIHIDMQYCHTGH